MENNQINIDPVANQQMPQSVQPVYNAPVKKNSVLKKVLMIIGGIVLGFIVFWFLAYFIATAGSNKLVCKSAEGKITIMYKDNKITGYKAVGMTYDLEGQKLVAETYGIEYYLVAFEEWFATNTTGTCVRK